MMPDVRGVLVLKSLSQYSTKNVVAPRSICNAVVSFL